MSYDLGIWYPHNRLSNEEALQQYRELCEGNVDNLESHLAIAEFYIELSLLHPEIDSIPESKIGDFDFCPYSIEHDFSNRHILLSCVWSHADYVHDLVLKLANKHGLAVFDPQLKIIHYHD
jgi:hypothetical protein